MCLYSVPRARCSGPARRPGKTRYSQGLDEDPSRVCALALVGWLWRGGCTAALVLSSEEDAAPRVTSSSGEIKCVLFYYRQVPKYTPPSAPFPSRVFRPRAMPSILRPAVESALGAARWFPGTATGPRWWPSAEVCAETSKLGLLFVLFCLLCPVPARSPAPAQERVLVMSDCLGCWTR